MRLCYTILVCGIGAGLVSVSGAPGQQRHDADRPSIGLALSGGAALGLAHIGVLRYFEEHHIPVDKVGGTSMGGLVGGLYAVGMDSNKIEALTRRADWNALLNPSPPFADQPIDAVMFDHTSSANGNAAQEERAQENTMKQVSMRAIGRNHIGCPARSRISVVT